MGEVRSVFLARYNATIRTVFFTMQTIEILPDSPTTPHSKYRATCGNHQATGQTAGQALDTLEAELDITSTETGETLIILQRFRPDDLFNATQQQRLRELMDQFHAAIDQGTQLLPSTQTELESLIEAELEANIQRSQRLLQHRNQNA